MVNMLAPRTAPVDPLLDMKFWLMVSGIYFWEFLTNLDYEWRVFRGHERYRWTIWIYSIARLSCLTTVILAVANFSITTDVINCQAWVVTGWVFSTLGCYGLAWILIILRIFAIWGRNKVVLAIAVVILVSNMGFQLSGIISLAHAVWVPAARACVNTHLTNFKGLALGTLVTDISLLLIMLAGLLRLRHRDGNFIELTYVLWKQGVIWLVIAVTAQLSQVLFLYLNVNVVVKELFSFPALITIVIAATRMYRDLTYYGSTPVNTTGPGSSNFPKSSRIVSGTKNSSIVHTIPPNRLEVTVNKAYEEYSMSQMNRCGSLPSSDAQVADKPPHELGLGLDDDV